MSDTNNNFQYILSYKDELVRFLETINPNITWNNVLNEIMTYPVRKFLNRMKAYVWTDKDEELDDDKQLQNTYVYYQRLLCMIDDLIHEEGKRIIIIDEPKNSLIDSDVVNNKVMIKADVLKRLLTLMRVKYDVCDNKVSVDSNCIVFPVCSVMYEDINILSGGFIVVIWLSLYKKKTSIKLKS